MATEKSTIYGQDGGGIMPLRPSDLVFNKTPDGIMSCGYMVKNAMLNSTLNTQSQSGGGNKKKVLSDNGGNVHVNNSKIMEDLVVPSSLYYCRPIYKHKVFNCKKGDCDNIAKKGKNKGKGKREEDEEDNEYDHEDEEYHDNSVINESLFDKLLSLVSPGKRMQYDNKTRKSTSGDLNGKQVRMRMRMKTKRVNQESMGEMGDTVETVKTGVTGETGENKKMGKKNNTIKNTKINKNKRTRRVKFIIP
jgi:hypothetical protein